MVMGSRVRVPSALTIKKPNEIRHNLNFPEQVFGIEKRPQMQFRSIFRSRSV